MDTGTWVAIIAALIAGVAAGISLWQTKIAKGQLDLLRQQLADAEQQRTSAEEEEQVEIALDIWRKAEKVISNYEILIDDHERRALQFMTALPLIVETKKRRMEWADTVMVNSVRIDNEDARRAIEEVRVTLDEIVDAFISIIRKSPVIFREDRARQSVAVKEKLAKVHESQRKLYAAVTVKP